MTTTALAVPEYLLDLRTGEQLEPTPENAAALLARLRHEYKPDIQTAIHACEAVLIECARTMGTKTLDFGHVKAMVYGGSTPDWDLEELAKLRDVGLPEERWNELVTETVSYKVNAAVAKQIAGANSAYAEVIARARRDVETPMRVKVA